MSEQRPVTFPLGDSGVDTNGTYGEAVLPDGFAQRPVKPGYSLMVGSYDADTVLNSSPLEYSNRYTKYYFFPNQPERGVLMKGGSVPDAGLWLKPDGSIYTGVGVVPIPNLRNLVQFSFVANPSTVTHYLPPNNPHLPTNNSNAIYKAER